MAALAVVSPVVLEPNVNPLDSVYVAHPDWYLLPILQFVKVSGAGAGLASLAGAVLLLLLFFVPFMQRKVSLTGLIAIGLVSGGLLLWAKNDERGLETRGRLDRQAFLAAQDAAKPFEPDQIGSSGTVVRDRIPPVPRQFAVCAECHGDLGGGGMIGPDLINVGKKYGSAERLEAVLLDPQAFGLAPEQMPGFTDDRMPAYERRALIQYLISLPRN
jgi:mono/diheme cytochrome c family protein